MTLEIVLMLGWLPKKQSCLQRWTSHNWTYENSLMLTVPWIENQQEKTYKQKKNGGITPSMLLVLAFIWNYPCQISPHYKVSILSDLGILKSLTTLECWRTPSLLTCKWRVCRKYLVATARAYSHLISLEICMSMLYSSLWHLEAL